MRRVISLTVQFLFIWTIVLVFFLLKTLPESFVEQGEMSVKSMEVNNVKKKNNIERFKVIEIQRKTFYKLRKSFEEHRHLYKFNNTFKTAQYNPNYSQTLQNQDRTLFLPSKPHRINEMTWFKNFHPKPVDANRFEFENENFTEKNVDYIVTDTGEVNQLVQNNKTFTISDGDKKMTNDTNINGQIQTLRLRRKENEKHYYSLRMSKVNPIDHDFSISGSLICGTGSKYMTLLIVVPSIPSHFNVRNMIRKTYGAYSKKPYIISNINVKVTVRLVFLLGRTRDINMDRLIWNESMVYSDVVVSDFIESYRNLTRKMLIALKWVSIYCSDIDFLLKIDEDMFVNVPQLAKALHSRLYDIKGAVYGYINGHSYVHRSGKWKVSKEEFPLNYYPNYASGNSYVISGNIITNMFITSEYIPYMPIEDAFITGCLARIIGAKIVPVPGFACWNDDPPDPCKFVKDRKISATKVTLSMMEELWKASISYREMCMT